jgi:hypothetical protein
MGNVTWDSTFGVLFHDGLGSMTGNDIGLLGLVLVFCSMFVLWKSGASAEFAIPFMVALLVILVSTGIAPGAFLTIAALVGGLFVFYLLLKVMGGGR